MEGVELEAAAIGDDDLGAEFVVFHAAPRRDDYRALLVDLRDAAQRRADEEGLALSELAVEALREHLADADPHR